METVADVLAAGLQQAGVEIVFGLPGGETVEVLDAMRRCGIRFELVHDESSAVFMADATARLTGKPGVCLTTLGPGATNAMAGVAHAYLDRAPVLVITAQKPDHLLPDYTHQVLDLQALYAPITKRSIKVKPENVGKSVRAALELVQSGRPGPVHLQLSNEDAGQPALNGLPTLADASPTVASEAGISGSPLAAARQLLSQAQRPVMVAGVGLEPERPYTALQELAESLHAPVVVTPKAKGSLPDDHPLSAGTVGLTRTDPVYEILDDADCIVAVGFDVVELVKPWDQAGPLIWIANWANEDPALPAEVEFVGAMAPVLQQLTDTGVAAAADWGAQRVAAFREKLAQEKLPDAAVGRMLPQAVLRALRRHLPREALMAVDVGSHKIFGSLTWPTYVPNRFFVSNGLSCMGFALPASIAAGLILQQPVACLTGDAGLSMALGEMGVLARTQSPVIVVVLNDGAIDLIRSQQVRAGKPVYGTEFPSPRFADIARAYGIEAIEVCSESECARAVQRAVRAAQPTLIEALIDPVSYPTTPTDVGTGHT